MSFADDISKFTVKVKANTDTVARNTVMRMFDSLLMRSPVGNANLWKVNEAEMQKSKSKRSLKKPAGYVGGHYRTNWQIGLNSLPTDEIEGVVKSRAAIKAREEAKVPKQAAGNVYFLTNNVPYVWPIEDGHSGQAPQGVAGLTALQFGGIVAEETAKVNK